MTLIRVTSSTVRIVSGNVTRIVRCQPLAPSTSAASLTSFGTAWMAATNRIIPKPMTFHVIEMMIAHSDVLGLTPSHRIGSSMIPRSSRAALISP